MDGAATCNSETPIGTDKKIPKKGLLSLAKELTKGHPGKAENFWIITCSIAAKYHRKKP